MIYCIFFSLVSTTIGQRSHFLSSLPSITGTTSFNLLRAWRAFLVVRAFFAVCRYPGCGGTCWLIFVHSTNLYYSLTLLPFRSYHQFVTIRHSVPEILAPLIFERQNGHETHRWVFVLATVEGRLSFGLV